MKRTSFSLQRTLAIRFSLTMFVALLCLAVWSYLGVSRILLQQLDTSLRNSAQFQVTQLADMGAHRGSQSCPVDCLIRDANRFVALRDPSGRIVASNNARAADLPLHPVSFAQSSRGSPRLTTEEWGGRRVRSIYLGLPPGSTSPGSVLQVAASLTLLEGSLRTILVQMLATVLLATLATAVGAAWLAGSAVAPVREIAAQAQSITGTVSGQRITAHAHVRECHGLIEVLNAMLDRLERAANWHRRMIRDLGHDLRTPITAMRAGVEVALWADRSPDDYRRVLASSLEEIDRLALISDALVLLGRLQAGEVALNLADIDLRVVAGEAVGRAQAGVGEHQISLAQPRDPVLVRADARLLGMVLDQLVDNARRYTPAGSRIQVVVGADHGDALLTVEDNGPGVAPEVLPHLFEPFYRSDSARGREGGPGLGLTASGAVASLHDGRIVAQRGAEGGLRVTVSLPRVHPSETHSGTFLSELPARAGSASLRADRALT